MECRRVPQKFEILQDHQVSVTHTDIIEVIEIIAFDKVLFNKSVGDLTFDALCDVLAFVGRDILVRIVDVLLCVPDGFVIVVGVGERKLRHMCRVAIMGRLGTF